MQYREETVISVKKTVLITFCCFPIFTLMQLIRFPSGLSDALRLIIYAAVYIACSSPVIIYCIKNKIHKKSLGLTPDKPIVNFIVCILLFAAVLLLGPFFMCHFASWGSGHLSPSVYIVVLCFIVAVSEEFVFRGFLLQGIRKHYSHIKAVLISSLVFAVFHVSEQLVAVLPFILSGTSLITFGSALASSISSFAFTFSGGVIFGTATALTKNLYPAIFLHAAANIVFLSI